MATHQILQNQILRLAKIYNSKPISVENIEWHNRVLNLQVSTIEQKKKSRKPKYFYFDNWDNSKKMFNTKTQAIQSAKKCTGDSITIFEIGTNKIIFAQASGHCPA